MKIAFLWATLTGYIGGALKALDALPEVSLFVADNVGSGKQAPFAESLFAWIAPENRLGHSGNPDAAELIARLEAFQPDLLLVASWSTPAYNKACEHFRGRAVRVCGIDNPWYGTAKQRLGALTSPLYVQRLFDCALVAGERQRVFAEHLGFDCDHIWQGLYCPDYAGFSAVRLPAGVARPKSFLFTGRLVEDKGLDVLAAAYKIYRDDADARGIEPWPLHVIGGGVLEPLIKAVPGVVFHGFVQPDKLPAFFGANGCFVLPSIYEHWGVVLQEAAVAGLPLICSDECGAAVHYLIDGYNGRLVKTGSVASLAKAMIGIGSVSDEEFARMSAASLALSEQLTPDRWARYIVEKASSALLTQGIA